MKRKHKTYFSLLFTTFVIALGVILAYMVAIRIQLSGVIK